MTVTHSGIRVPPCHTHPHFLVYDPWNPFSETARDLL